MGVSLRCLLVFLIFGDHVTSFPNGWSAGKLYNSSVACTRGSQQTLHDLDCRNGSPQGLVGRMYINRIFYGTTPLSKGCNRTASFSACCLTDPDVDCVFESDVDLNDTVRRFTGFSQATFSGVRRYTSLGNCDSKIYPNLTSFSFVEYGCASVSLLKDITANVTSQYKEALYLDSNSYFNNSNVQPADFHCVAQTECNSTLSFIALFLQRVVDSHNQCAEEFFFQDGKYPDVKSNLTCADGDLIFNQVLFTSVSNVGMINMSIKGHHTGRVFIKVTSSTNTSTVSLTCGAEYKRIMESLEPCAGDTYFAHTTSSVTPSAAGMPPVTNSTSSGVDSRLIIGLVVGIQGSTMLLIIVCGFISQIRQRKPSHKAGAGDSEMRCSTCSVGVPEAAKSVGHTVDLPIIDSGSFSAPPSYTEVSGDCNISHQLEDDDCAYYLHLEGLKRQTQKPNGCDVFVTNTAFADDEKSAQT